MFYQVFKKNSIQQLIIFFSIFCFLFTSQLPSKLLAEPCSSLCPAVLENEQDALRAKNATIVVGTTIIALIGGVAWLALGSSCHKKHHCYCSSYSSSCSYGY